MMIRDHDIHHAILALLEVFLTRDKKLAGEGGMLGSGASLDALKAATSRSADQVRWTASRHHET